MAYAKIRMERRKDLEEEMKRKKDEIEAPLLEIPVREMDNAREKIETAGDHGGETRGVNLEGAGGAGALPPGWMKWRN